jgi:hypothetical protein
VIGFPFLLILRIICCLEPIHATGLSERPAATDTHSDPPATYSCYDFYYYYYSKDSSNSSEATSSATAPSCSCPHDKELAESSICV